MTGSCRTSYPWRDLPHDQGVKRTSPYRPKSNGGVERFARTLAEECAYARPPPDRDRAAGAFAVWSHHYGHHRFRTEINGPPVTRTTTRPGRHT
ncbi:integrase core domain-containing protein [Marinactinospora thermotolerans]|uniref:integrase core domain-containing protein n=1 Tax=Marinactinospora thermotolerans TaxID=531310 RepID=UPI003D944858